MTGNSILLIVPILGPLSGLIVAHFSKEEIKICQRYFPYILSSVIFFISRVSFHNPAVMAAMVFILILILLFYPRFLFYIYPLVFLFYLIPDNRQITAGLIYLYGLPVGSMLYLNFISNKKRL